MRLSGTLIIVSLSVQSGTGPDVCSGMFYNSLVRKSRGYPHDLQLNSCRESPSGSIVQLAAAILSSPLCANVVEWAGRRADHGREERKSIRDRFL